MKHQDACESCTEPRRDRRLACPAERARQRFGLYLSRNTASRPKCGRGHPHHTKIPPTRHPRPETRTNLIHGSPQPSAVYCAQERGSRSCLCEWLKRCRIRFLPTISRLWKIRFIALLSCTRPHERRGRSRNAMSDGCASRSKSARKKSKPCVARW